MWTIIKTEIKYNKIILICGFCCIFFFQLWINIRISNANPLERNFDALLNTMFLFCLGILILSYSLFVKEKRNLLYSLVPVSKHHLGFVRLLLYVSIWTCSVVLLLVAQILSNNLLSLVSNFTYLLALGSYTGIFLFINAFFLITSDLSGILKNKNTTRGMLIKNIASFGAVLCILAILITPSPPLVDTFVESILGQSFKQLRFWLFQTGEGFYFSIFLGSGMSLLSVISFRKRKSYIE